MSSLMATVVVFSSRALGLAVDEKHLVFDFHEKDNDTTNDRNMGRTTQQGLRG